MRKRVYIASTSRRKRAREKCVMCGKAADVRYRRQWMCGDCLNPEPDAEYMRIEREMVNGQWGGMPVESWGEF